MKMLTIKQMIAALVAVLSVCLFIGLLYSQPFADFANADESTAFDIYTTPVSVMSFRSPVPAGRRWLRFWNCWRRAVCG